MLALRWICGVCGVAVVGLTWVSLITSLIVPRRSQSWLQRWLQQVDRRFFGWLSSRFDDYLMKDRILAYFGPVSLLMLLTTWLGLFFLGYSTDREIVTWLKSDAQPTAPPRRPSVFFLM